MPLTIRIIYPAGQASFGEVPEGITELGSRSDCRVLPNPLPPPADPAWPYAAGSAVERAEALASALLDDDGEVVWCGRGGYGASDLLPLLPWAELERARPKWLVGFSDISCLHSALWSRLGWPGLHGPMPASNLWGQGSGDDVEAILALLAAPRKEGRLSLDAPSARGDADGWLFGGCFSVLTNLIATPYFPASLAGAIVFWEDIGENPGRLMRYLNQWLQSGVLAGVAGVVLGDLAALDSSLSQERVKEEFARRLPVPVWTTRSFGHTAPNFPLMIGARATIGRGDAGLRWELGAGVGKGGRHAESERRRGEGHAGSRRE